MSTATRLGNERRTRQVEAASYDAAGRRIEWEDMRAQTGPQQIFLSTRADIAITGGAAGGGKTFSLLMEPLRHIARPNFNAVCFRRTNPMIEAAGGLWDESEKIYPMFPFCGNGVRGNKDWNFPSGARISMRHLEHEKNVLDWYGSQIPLIMFDQLEQFCLHPETEVLTQTGWKQITEVAVGEIVASLTADERLVYLPVERVWKTPCTSGKLLNLFQRKGISFRATTGHRFPVRMQGSRGRWKWKTAETLNNDRVLRVSSWEDGVEQDWHSIRRVAGRGIGTNTNQVDRVRMDDWLRFLGWWFSEGGTYIVDRRPQSQTPQVNFTQTGKHKTKLRKAIRATGYRFHETRRGTFVICSRQLYDELHPLGDTYTKRIPRWVYKLSKRQLQIFWEAFVCGDGHTDNRGLGDAIGIGLANEGLIDDLQEMAVLLGLVATKGQSVARVNGKEFQVWRLSVSKSTRGDCWVRPDQAKEEAYHGSVWCLVVPQTHTFLARHRGRYFWSGNTESQWWGMISRNRTTIGIRPYVRATCNPDADCFLAEFLKWWIDEETGYAIPERSGVIRWFVRLNEQLQWAGSWQELHEKFDDLVSPEGVYPDGVHDRRIVPKSVTFIPAYLHDNPILMAKDPGYRGNLLMQPLVERERLEKGNWKIRHTGGTVFPFGCFGEIQNMPAVDRFHRVIRYWDKACLVAGTEIETTEGTKPIENVTTNDCVLTRDGFKQVRWSGISTFVDDLVSVLFSDGSVITGTPDHLIWTENRNWVGLATVDGGDYNVGLTQRNALWDAKDQSHYRTRKLLSSMGERIDDDRASDISRVFAKSMDGGLMTRCIAPSGDTTTVRYPLAMMSTTRTMIGTTTTLQILNASHIKSILGSTKTSGRIQNTVRCWHALGQLLNNNENTFNLPEVASNGSGSQSKCRLGYKHKTGSSINGSSRQVCATHMQMPQHGQPFAFNVGTCSLTNPYASGHLESSPFTVRPNARISEGMILGSGLWTRFANSAESLFVAQSVCRLVPAVAVLYSDGVVPVYDLSVDGPAEFFANGILVHNCSTNEGSDYTAGVLMGEVRGATPLDKEWWVLDVIFGRWTASERNARMLESAKEDAGIFGRKYRVAMEQEPGSGGKESADYSIKLLAGYRASANRSTGSKVDRAAPYSSQAQRGNIKIVHGSAWNKAFLDQHYAFPTQEGKGDIVKHDDIVDAAAGAFNELVRKKAFCVA